MSLQANEFRLGLFFILAAVAFLAIIAWLGGWFGDEESRTYVSYFPWSVQGLEKGSAVRYNGVPIGTVESIRIAPDGRLVEVVMSISTDFPVRDDLAANLQFVGITGIKVINLQSRDGGATVPEMGFEPAHPVIPVAKGSMETLESALERASAIMSEVDFQGLSDKTGQLLENLNDLLESAMVEDVANSIIGAAEGVDSLSRVYARLGIRLESLADSLQRSAPELSGRVGRLAERVDTLTCRLNSLAASGGELMAEADHLMRGLRVLLATLRSRPEELVFGGGGTEGGGWR
jgi:phospholipid/cholesterol/gamma-HCH transport system substrate-binding protein